MTINTRVVRKGLTVSLILDSWGGREALAITAGSEAQADAVAAKLNDEITRQRVTLNSHLAVIDNAIFDYAVSLHTTTEPGP